MSNEAAERLRYLIDRISWLDIQREKLREAADAALAAERKATVERIRAAALVEGMEENINPFDLVHILDAEAER